MKLLSFELERYGAFEGKRLVFDPTKTLHVVHGPNEAGKSTALAGVADLLFRFEQRESRAFRFKAQDLRLGAEIVARDGARLAFRRRRGTVSTLRDRDEAPLPEDALDRFLSGVTRKVFLEAFGLSAETLRAGGQAMLKADGDLGRGILAAAAGLAPLARLGTELGEEARALFAPRARSGRVHEATAAFEAARKAMSDATLTPKALDEAITRRDALTAEKTRLADAQRELRARARVLDRARAVGPVLQRLKALEAEAAALADVAGRGAADAVAIRSALATARDASGALAKAGDDAVAARLKSEEIVVPRGPLDHAMAIEALAKVAGKIQGAREDIPKRRHEAREAELVLAAAAGRLGLSDADAVAALAPSAADLAEANQLAARGAALPKAADDARAALVQAREALLDAERARDIVPSVADPATLRQRLEGSQRLREAAARQARLEAEVRGIEHVVDVDRARLVPPVADLATLARLPLPPRDLVERFRREREQLDLDARDLDRGIDETKAEIEAARLAVEAARADGLASDDALADARRLRDAAVARALPVLAGTAKPDPDLGAELVAAIASVDRVAEARVTDGARFGAAEEARRRLERARSKLDGLEGEARSRLMDARAANERGHAEAWAASGLAPAAPAAMIAFHDAVTAARARLAEIEPRRVDADELATRISKWMPALFALARDVDLSPPPEIDPSQLLDTIEHSIRSADLSWTQRRDALAKVATAIDKRDQAAAALRRVEENIQAWRAEWSVLAPRLGLSPDIAPDAARPLVAAWNEVPKAIDDRGGALARVAAMERDALAFDDEARRLAGLVGEPSRGRDPLDVSAALSARLVAARSLETVHAERERRRVDAEEALAGQHRAAARARAAIETLASTLAVATEALEDVAGKIERRSDIARDMGTVLDQLNTLGDGLDRATLEAEAASIDRALAVEERADIEVRLDATAEEANANAVALAEAERRLTEMGGRDIAERTAQARAIAVADLAEAARDHARLEAARLLVERALERHRARHQHPLIERGGALFARMTGGDFSGLRVTTDGDGAAVLEAIRAGGEAVPLAGLSEGTGDQLFLSLRLASLEAFAETADPPPFLADDLVASFDERRAGLALEVMAEVGARAQVILFTHHAHVAAIARERLGDMVDLVAL